MANQTPEQVVLNIISNQTGLEETQITRDKPVADLGTDSIDNIELVMEIEDMLEIELPDEEIQNLKTVGELLDLVKTKVP